MAAQERATILAAEDNDRLRALLAALLELEGHRVLEAADGVRMVRLLIEEQVDALILDVRFGADDGVALGPELRQELPADRAHQRRQLRRRRDLARGGRPFQAVHVRRAAEYRGLHRRRQTMS